MQTQSPLLLIDSYNIAFRLFHTGAVSAEIFFQQIRFIGTKFPKHRIILTADSGKNWRHTVYQDYKANRPSVPGEFITELKQLPIIAQIHGYPWLSVEGWEADDIIFTLIEQNPKRQITVVSSDKDLYQLLAYKNVSIWSQGKYITPSDVKRKLDIAPEMVRDFLALVGDASDNIPGVPKIGPKTAAALLNQYQSLDGILANLEQLPSDAKHTSLKNNTESAKLSRELATLKIAPVSLPEYTKSIMAAEDSQKIIKEALEVGWIAFYKDQEIASASAWAQYDITQALPQLTNVRIISINNTQHEDLNILHHMLYGALASPASAYEIAQLWIKMQQDLHKYQCARSYYLADYNLPQVLRAMEAQGAYIDLELLSKLDHQLTESVTALEATIYQQAGKEFLISSPQQLAKIFQEMNLSQSNKTDLQTLENISHPIVDSVLEFRHLKKLLNTYIQPLIRLADANHRVHTSYTMTATKTGRLSSVAPNLQNIPIKSELGRTLRNAFLAPPGKVLIIADYDQVELRILAHIGNVPNLIQKFKNGEDWHGHVAQVLFGEVTPDTRRSAKTVTFGLIYGMSVYGLAQRLRITRAEAEVIKDSYHQSFPEIADYQERTTAFARQHGYVQTLWGRRCYVSGPDLHRQAINAPIQGTAAEIIKHKMQFIPNLILQVHDELVVEVNEDDAQAAHDHIKRTLEVHNLTVPLTVNTKIAKRWGL